MTLLDELYAVWNQHDVDAILGFFSEEMTYTDQTLGAVFVNKQTLRDFVSLSFVAVPDLSFDITSSFDNGAHFAGEALMRGTQSEDLPGLPVSGKPFEVHYGIYGDLVDGRISRLVDYWNLAEWTAS